MIVWRGVETAGTEECLVKHDGLGVLMTGAVAGSEVDCRYRIRVSSTWHFECLELETTHALLIVERSGGDWVVNGAHRLDLADALEIDLSNSPVTNTLPIRRLGLDISESADIVTAYVSVPGLSVTPDPQRYTRTGALEYLYESRSSDFRRTITVDDEGFVIDYPGLFTRRQ